jgi:AraC-like DNA-binding protein
MKSTLPVLEELAKQAKFKGSDMAMLCGISQRHLQRMFKTHFGSSPGKWLRALQCRLARELIVQGYSNKAAAAELSFANDSHFCREFKKIFGASPGELAPVRRPPGLSKH